MIDIIEKMNIYKGKKRRNYPSKSNRASEVGHPCTRYLVWNRTKWKEKYIHSTGLQYIFDEGVEHEKIIIRELQEAGLSLIENQRFFEWEKYNITGHLDFKILDGKTAIPVEFKSLNPYTWQSITSVNDLKKNKSFFFRKYVDQLTLYLLMDEKELGMFLLKNKSTGKLKQIMMKLDYDYGEKIIQKVELINKHVDGNTDPEPIEWDERTCGNCGFKHICCNEITGDELKFFDDEEMEKKLDRYFELKNLTKAYKKIDDELKSELFEVNNVVCGNYKIDGKWIEKKAFEVKAGRYWGKTIKNIGT